MSYPRLLIQLACLMILAAGCAKAPDLAANRARVRAGSMPLNILVITLDTTRADRLGCYGYDKVETPAIDALAADGVLFEDTVTSVPLTLPSHASIFTGTTPPFHGVHSNDGKLLDEPNECLAEIARDEGYATAAFVGAAVLQRNGGLAQGFETYADDFAASGTASSTSYPEKPAEVVVRDAIGWLKQKKSSPFFLWVHLFDPHAPYRPPSSAGRIGGATNGYDAEIAYADKWIGELIRFLDNQGLRDDTLIAFLSDHGEGLGEHNEATHGYFLYDTTIRVPFILTCKKLLPAGTRIDSLTRTIDLMPTVLDLIGADIEDAIQGTSLVPRIDGEPADIQQAYAETYYPYSAFGWSPLLALRQESMKVIHAPRPELYDLSADPHEKKDLFQNRGELGNELLASLEARAASISREGVTASRSMDAQTRKMLQRLGYVTGTAPDPAKIKSAQDAGTLPDPKDRIGAIAECERAAQLVTAGQLAEARSALEALLQREPRCATALSLLGQAAISAQDFARAESAYQRLLRLKPGDADALINLAAIYRTLEQPRRAAPFLEQALNSNPTSADALIMLADIEHNVLGRRDRARTYYERFLEAAPSDAYAPQVRKILETL